MRRRHLATLAVNFPLWNTKLRRNRITRKARLSLAQSYISTVLFHSVRCITGVTVTWENLPPLTKETCTHVPLWLLHWQHKPSLLYATGWGILNWLKSTTMIVKGKFEKTMHEKIKRCAKQSSHDEVYDCRSYCISVLGIETPTCLLRRL